MNDKPGFRDHLRILRESQKRPENPPAKPAETDLKFTVMEWIRAGFRFPAQGVK
jgi:hypothetical protein